MFRLNLSSRWIVGVGMAGCLIAGKVLAEPEMSAEDRWLLAKYDTNGDQVISTDEIAEKRKKMFSGMDMDADGGVSFGEYQKIDNLKREKLLKARFNKLDLDQDGVLTGPEYCSYLGSFERFDQNGDGNISSSEIEMKESSPEQTDLAAAENDDPYCLLWFCVRKNMR